MKKLIAATSTPLASIFGSGFLIIVPILNGAVGKYAVFAMAVVCALAYCVGYAIRFNIKNAEPLLKPLGYATGQFGKNHLGDKEEMLPSNHGFDEFYGILYHLNAMEEPYQDDYPKSSDFHKQFGPRNIIETKATSKDDSTTDPRWGKVGKQTIKDAGPLPPGPNMDKNAKFDMTNVDEELGADHPRTGLVGLSPLLCTDQGIL